MAERVDIFIGSLRGGGIERMCVIFANALVQRGVNVRLVVLDLKDAAYADLLDPRVHVVDFAIVAYARNIIGPFTAYIRETRPTCCYAFYSLLTELLVLLRDLHRFPITIIGEQHNNWTLYWQAIQQARPHSWWYRYVSPAIQHRLYTRADHVVAVSEGVRRQLVHEYGFRDTQVSTIYNCVDPQLQARAAQSQPTPEPAAIYAIGRLTYQKGFDRLIEAFSYAVNTALTCTCTLSGKGNYAKLFSNKSHGLG